MMAPGMEAVGPAHMVSTPTSVLERAVTAGGPVASPLVHGCTDLVPGADARSPLVHGCTDRVPRADGGDGAQSTGVGRRGRGRLERQPLGSDEHRGRCRVGLGGVPSYGSPKIE